MLVLINVIGLVVFTFGFIALLIIMGSINPFVIWCFIGMLINGGLLLYDFIDCYMEVNGSPEVE